jgi:hypothetical protein
MSGNCYDPDPCTPTPCNDCTEPVVPQIEFEPPPECEDGEKCVELYPGECVKYTGDSIPCLGILNNENINSVIAKLAARLCDCCDGTLPVINCVVSDWSAWGPCVDGVQTRTRYVIQSAQNGGTACPDLEETRACVDECANPVYELTSPTCESLLVTVDTTDSEPTVQIHYREFEGEDPTWISAGSFDTSVDNTIGISDLTAGVTYEVRVRTMCLEDAASSWVIDTVTIIEC